MSSLNCFEETELLEPYLKLINISSVYKVLNREKQFAQCLNIFPNYKLPELADALANVKAKMHNGTNGKKNGQKAKAAKN